MPFVPRPHSPAVAPHAVLITTDAWRSLFYNKQIVEKSYYDNCRSVTSHLTGADGHASGSNSTMRRYLRNAARSACKTLIGTTKYTSATETLIFWRR